jgi:Family of unknown function (DUF6510)
MRSCRSGTYRVASEQKGLGRHSQRVALHGAAIAGDLHEVHGVGFTRAKSVRAAYGASSVVADAVVYPRCPERVARCRVARC